MRASRRRSHHSVSCSREADAAARESAGRNLPRRIAPLASMRSNAFSISEAGRPHTMHCLEPFIPLGGYPITVSRDFRYEGAVLELQALKESIPAGGEQRFGFRRAES